MGSGDFKFMIQILITVLLLAPLVGFFFNGWRWSDVRIHLAGAIGSLACMVSFICGLVLFNLLLNNKLDAFDVSFFPWVQVGDFSVSFSFLIDPLSVLMLLVITGVGFLIHLFSIYYMKHDSRPARYFAYLNLFLFSMMILVLADNLLLMFIGWEGVGLCSYLLIGFWFQDEKKARAGLQAFIVNRVGDIGFLIAMFILFSQLGSLQFKEMISAVSIGSLEGASVWIVCLCLLLGAVGKSAQIPLYVWLPPAMAGPTPVSALIHAATMVTAGVYLICRMSFLFVLTPSVLNIVSWIGAISALWAALVAAAQTDIKKVLAYSTVSQLGYMFIAVGLGAFSTGLFHLMTHACFKALLFLSAGAVIHICAGEQNIYQMGGVKARAPFVWFSFFIGTLALIGLPPLAGFFSKDEILWSALSSGQIALFVVAGLAAVLTVFYMTRVFILVFHGQPRGSLDKKQIHSLGFCAKFPLMALSVLSVITGALGLPHLIRAYLPGHPPHFLQEFLKSSLSPYPVVHHLFDSHSILWAEASLMISSSVVITLVASVTGYIYLKKSEFLQRIKNKYLFLFHTLEQGGFVNSFYHKVFVKPVLHFSHELEVSVDRGLVQGLLIVPQRWILLLKDTFMLMQNGKIQQYATYILIGVIILMLGVLLG